MARVGVKRIRAIARSEAKDVLSDTAEHKYEDFVPFVSPQDIGSTAFLQHISAVSAGTAPNQRLGLSVRGLSVFVRYQLRWSLVAPIGTGNVVRCAIILDTASDGLLPSAVNTPQSILSGTAASTVAQWNPLTRKRFLILKSWTDVVWLEHPVVNKKKFIKLKMPVVNYFDSTSGITSAGVNSLYFMIWTDVAAGAASPKGDWRIRFRFMDM